MSTVCRDLYYQNPLYAFINVEDRAEVVDSLKNRGQWPKALSVEFFRKKYPVLDRYIQSKIEEKNLYVIEADPLEKIISHLIAANRTVSAIHKPWFGPFVALKIPSVDSEIFSFISSARLAELKSQYYYTQTIGADDKREYERIDTFHTSHIEGKLNLDRLPINDNDKRFTDILSPKDFDRIREKLPNRRSYIKAACPELTENLSKFTKRTIGELCETFKSYPINGFHVHQIDFRRHEICRVTDPEGNFSYHIIGDVIDVLDSLPESSSRGTYKSLIKQNI